MPVSYSMTSGGGSNSSGLQNPTFAQLAVQLPDAYPGNLIVIGTVQGNAANLNAAAQQVSASIALPAVPGSGTTFWNLQIDVTSGAATIQTSSSAYPAAINANNIIVAQGTIPTGSTIPWIQGVQMLDFTG